MGLLENIMGTKEQNEAAQKRMDEMDKKNPDSMQAKVNAAIDKVTGRKKEEQPKPEEMKTEPVKKAKGGSVGSASKRADGIAMRGKTRGKIC